MLAKQCFIANAMAVGCSTGWLLLCCFWIVWLSVAHLVARAATMLLPLCHDAVTVLCLCWLASIQLLLSSIACAGLPASHYCRWLIVQFLTFKRIVATTWMASVLSSDPALLGIQLCCCCCWWLIVFKETIFILSEAAVAVIVTAQPQLWPEYRGLQAMCCCSQACIAVLALAAWCIGFHCWSVIVSSATAWCCCHLDCCQCHQHHHLSHHRLIVVLYLFPLLYLFCHDLHHVWCCHHQQCHCLVLLLMLLSPSPCLTLLVDCHTFFIVIASLF